MRRPRAVSCATGHLSIHLRQKFAPEQVRRKCSRESFLLLAKHSKLGFGCCESGGIGRRTRLRIWRVKPWGFESPLSHQQLATPRTSQCFSLCPILHPPRPGCSTLEIDTPMVASGANARSIASGLRMDVSLRDRDGAVARNASQRESIAASICEV
jgi:hypothetical protein